MSPICPISAECGGCQTLGVPYAEQLVEKERAMRALFAECSFAPEVRPVLGMDEPFGFRCKVISPFAPDRRASGARPARMRASGRRGSDAAPVAIACGMYEAGTHRIIPVDSCPVEHPAGRRVISAIRAIMARHRMEPYDEDAGTGFVRHAVVRIGHASDEVLVTVVTNGEEFPGARSFARELVRRCPEVTSIVQNVNTRSTNEILGHAERVIYGPGFILDELCGLSFRISSQSFYQVNVRQTEVLYRTAIEAAQLAGPEPKRLLDAYCGTGTIGLAACALGSNVSLVGVDRVGDAIRDARLNARHNGIEAEFVAQDAGEFMRRAAAEGERFDVLILDPPRSGASEEFLEALSRLAPERVVYISCNPRTQARDIRILERLGYRARFVQPVDMFPHTEHVETVCLLERDRAI